MNKLTLFDYEEMLQNALRSVVRDTLIYVEQQGLPGTHHFYITFMTNRSDVKMPASLRKKYPEEISIVLEHQFWDLTVKEEGFFVTLSFNNTHEEIFVPFNALTSFIDPSVEFSIELVTNKESFPDNIFFLMPKEPSEA